MRRAAVYGPWRDDQGQPIARLLLERDDDVPPPAGTVRPTAAWLMCNPSRAGHEIDDPTVLRVVGHSRRFGFARQLVGNVWCLRTPYPVDLWRMLRNDAYLPALDAANRDALAMMGAQAQIHIAAFGAEPARRYPTAVAAALDAFTNGGAFPLYCLGTTDGRMPLHPVARGRHAIRKDVKLREWRAAGPRPCREHCNNPRCDTVRCFGYAAD